MNHLLGMLGFMSKRQMRRKTRKKETSWEHRKRITFLWKEKKVGELQLSWRHLRRSVNVLTQREDEIRIHKNNPSASAAPAAYEPRWIYWGGCWRCDRFAPLNRAVALKAYKRSYTHTLHFYTSKEKQNRYFCFYNWVNKYPEQWVKSLFIIGHTQNILEL